MRISRIAALVLALALVALAVYVLALEQRRATCPASGSLLSCAAVVRPRVAALGPVSVSQVLLVGALTELLATGLVLARGARLPFARDAALLAAVGAGFALGLQPLALLATGRLCPACAAVVLVQGALALALGRLASGAGAPRKLLVLAFGGALAVTAPLAALRGSALATEDARRRAALHAAERPDGRLLLVTREGCPYCEALLLDVLSEPELLPRVARAGLRVAAPGSKEAPDETDAPVLRAGSSVTRGFVPDPAPYEEVLRAAEKP